MKRFLQISFLTLMPSILLGQNYQTEFQNCCKAQDTTCQKETLMKWEKANPNDPELFTSYFNYHFVMAKQETISISEDTSTGQTLELKDSTDNVVGFLGAQVYYNPIEVKRGFEKINKGIEKYPNRLDMRFGKIYVLGQMEDWESFTNEIIKTVKYSSKNKNKWTWTNNKKQEDGRNLLLSSIQDYQVQLFNTREESLLPNVRKIAKAILDLYPDHIESLSNLSITYLLLGEFDAAIETLLKAEKINPEDFIILSNIAHGYKLKGDNDKAIEYYEKTIQYGDAQAKEFARQKIEELRK